MSDGSFLIPIQKEGTPREWVLVELQGALQLRDGAESRISLDGLRVGLLTMKDEKNAILVVGNHQLDGSRMALKHPIGVFQKRQSAPSASSSVGFISPTKADDLLLLDTMQLLGASPNKPLPSLHQSSPFASSSNFQSSSQSAATISATTPEYVMVGLLKEKVYFKNRPRPVITSAPQGQHLKKMKA